MKSKNKLPDECHPDLLAAYQFAYDPSGFVCTLAPQKELESQEYEALLFELNNKRIRFRVAKITPKKIGQFVTFWKRMGAGPIMPYDLSDPFDFFVVSVRSNGLLGQFVFPKIELCRQGILSKSGRGGKRAIRVYPPWDKPESQQAEKSQQWQINFFLEIPQNGMVDIKRAKKLFF